MHALYFTEGFYYMGIQYHDHDHTLVPPAV